MTRRRRGGIKRGEKNLASNQFIRYSPQFGTLREFHSDMETIRGRRKKQLTRRIRGGVKRGEANLVSNQIPKCSP